MKQTSGFTLIELLTAVAIFAVLSAIAIPNTIRWRNNAQFRGGVNTLVSDLAVAKQFAIRLNSNITIRFSEDSYRVFVDNGAGTADADADGIPDGADNGSIDGTEEIILQREMPPGVTINTITFTDDITRFDAKGRCPSPNTGTVVLTGGQNSNTVSINRLGRIGVS